MNSLKQMTQCTDFSWTFTWKHNHKSNKENTGNLQSRTTFNTPSRVPRVYHSRNPENELRSGDQPPSQLPPVASTRPSAIHCLCRIYASTNSIQWFTSNSCCCITLVTV